MRFLLSSKGNPTLAMKIISLGFAEILRYWSSHYEYRRGELAKRVISEIMLTLILVGLASFTFNIQEAKAATITVPDDYPTIQEAIDHANEGDTISVRNGTYNEGATLKKNLTIIGENKLNTIIERLNASGLGDVYLANIRVNYLNARDSMSVWATGCCFPEVHVNSSARLLLSQSEAWKVHTYDKGEILGFYDFPFFGKIVFSFPFGFIVYLLPFFLALAVGGVFVAVYIRRKKLQSSGNKQAAR